MKDALGQNISIGCNVIYVLKNRISFNPVPSKIIGLINGKKEHVLINTSKYSHAPVRRLAKNVIVVDKILELKNEQSK